MEFTNSFWHYMVDIESFDVAFGEPVRGDMQAGNRNLVSAPKTSFLLAKTVLFNEASRNGISLDSRYDDNNIYDICYDWWKWLEFTGRKIY